MQPACQYLRYRVAKRRHPVIRGTPVTVCLLLVACLFSTSAAAQIYKCTDESGQIAFRDRPCAEGAASDIVENIPSGGSDNDNYSMWVEPNYVDTAYSTLLRSENVQEVASDSTIWDHMPFGWMPYRVEAEVLETYKGDLRQGATVTLLVYVSVLSKLARDRIQGDFLVSFCRSKSGVYYTSRDYLVIEAAQRNVRRFQHIAERGTDYEGAGDCSSSNYPSLNPDTHTR